MRIVIDSNVWVSALVFGRNPRRVFELVAQNGLDLVISEEILTECRRTLRKKFPGFLADFEALVVAIQRFTTHVKLGSVEINVSRDPKDNMVIETAHLGKANYIITGDKDLLVLGNYKNIGIVTPSQYLDL